MQNDATVGRVLLASLHQAIAEVLPERLEFYERWLTPWPGSRVLGVASFTAMLSFLQQEGVADAVAARAGQYAAIRAFGNLNVLERAFLRVLPRRLRARRSMRLLVRMLPGLYPESRIDTIRRRGTIFVGIDDSPFCETRGAGDRPACSFYASIVTTFLQLLTLRPSVRVSRCRSTGATSCLLMIVPDQTRAGTAEGVILDLADEQVATPATQSTESTAAASDTEPPPATPAPEPPGVTSPTAEEAMPPAEPAAPPDAGEPVPPPAQHAEVAVAAPAEHAATGEAAEPQGVTAVEPGPAHHETSAGEGSSHAPETVVSETAGAESAPEPDAEAAADAVANPTREPAPPTGWAARWAELGARQKPPRARVDIDALIAQPKHPEEDPELPWHRF